MSRILLTGGYGFIGSEVANRIFSEWGSVQTGAKPQLAELCSVQKLVVFDRVDYNSRPENINPEVRADPRFQFVKGDLCSFDLLSFLLEEYQIEIVIHIAAQTHVDLSFENSLKFTRDNVLGTHTLLEACRKYGKIQRFVHMSTDEVYGEAEDEAHHEGSHLNPTNPYAASKVSAEFVLRSYGYSYNFPYVIIRGNNVYGHGQYPDKVIPKFILYLHLDKMLPIHGSGEARRMFVHVDDMARGILLVAKKGALGEIYNIGSRNEYTVNEIARLLCLFMGKNTEKSIQYVPDRNFNDRRYFIGYKKVSELGWKEEIPFELGLRETIQWYLERVEEFQKKI